MLTITNHHIPECGVPPAFDTKNKFTAYFTDQYQEQFVVQYSKKKGMIVWSGDLGWDDPLRVTVLRGQGLLFESSKSNPTPRDLRRKHYDEIRKAFKSFSPPLTTAECARVYKSVRMSDSVTKVIHGLRELWKVT